MESRRDNKLVVHFHIHRYLISYFENLDIKRGNMGAFKAISLRRESSVKYQIIEWVSVT